ncbi:MAG: hypothetical protein IJY30_00640, partial [Muribaculaceae bacterium]|nr:hypothetical protein [Muribaculaceae bacterium]
MKIDLMNLCSGALLTGALLCGVPAFAANDMESNHASLPAYAGEDLELTVNNFGTHFRLWSPQADAAQVLIYCTDRNTQAIDTLEMKRAEQGTWTASVADKLFGKFYTFQIQQEGKKYAETPGVWAKAVGINGKRAA